MMERICLFSSSVKPSLSSPQVHKLVSNQFSEFNSRSLSSHRGLHGQVPACIKELLQSSNNSRKQSSSEHGQLSGFHSRHKTKVDWHS